MYIYYPVLIVGGIIGAISIIFLFAYLSIYKQKEAIGFDRNMKDGEIARRLLTYAKPYTKNFVFVLLLMLFSIAYDIISPLIVGGIEEMIKEDFEMSHLLAGVMVYASILVISRTAFRDSRRQAGYPCHQRYQRGFHDVHQHHRESGEELFCDHWRTYGNVAGELSAHPDGALLCALRGMVHLRIS